MEAILGTGWAVTDTMAKNPTKPAHRNRVVAVNRIITMVWRACRPISAPAAKKLGKDLFQRREAKNRIELLVPGLASANSVSLRLDGPVLLGAALASSIGEIYPNNPSTGSACTSSRGWLR